MPAAAFLAVGMAASAAAQPLRASSAIVLVAWGGVVIGMVDNFLRPRLVGGRVGLSELTIFFSLLGGLQVFGLLGIVLGPVLFAIAASMVDVLNE